MNHSRLYIVTMQKNTHGINDRYKVIATTYQDCIEKVLECALCKSENEILSIKDDDEVIL